MEGLQMTNELLDQDIRKMVGEMEGFQNTEAVDVKQPEIPMEMVPLKSFDLAAMEKMVQMSALISQNQQASIVAFDKKFSMLANWAERQSAEVEKLNTAVKDIQDQISDPTVTRLGALLANHTEYFCRWAVQDKGEVRETPENVWGEPDFDRSTLRLYINETSLRAFLEDLFGVTLSKPELVHSLTQAGMQSTTHVQTPGLIRNSKYYQKKTKKRATALRVYKSVRYYSCNYPHFQKWVERSTSNSIEPWEINEEAWTELKEQKAQTTLEFPKKVEEVTEEPEEEQEQETVVEPPVLRERSKRTKRGRENFLSVPSFDSRKRSRR